MPDQREPFSRRQGYSAEAPPIVVREDAPDNLRYAISQIATEQGLTPAGQRPIICRILRERPDSSNWSEYPNISNEVDGLLSDCLWYKIYDIAEAFYAELKDQYDGTGETYEKLLNDFLIECGIGWEMREGEVVARGSEVFSVATNEAVHELRDDGRETAARELHEALQDLSRRPQADITGAIQHAMAAAECLAKDISGEPNLTFGDVLNRYASKIGLRPPLDQALHKLWGYASQQGRHLTEGQEPEFEEAELVVGIAAIVCTYMTKKAGEEN